MEFLNRTRFPGALYRGVIDQERLYAAAVSRVSYDVVDGSLRPAERQTWQVRPTPWNTAYGTMHGDNLFYRGGVDLFVFGAARAPRGRPAPRFAVEIALGDAFRHRIEVHGERRWERRGRRLVASAAAPVAEVPLTLDRAFGGSGSFDGIDVPSLANPGGTGFHLDEAGAEGEPLPQLEDPATPIRAWDDRPDPVGTGLCPPLFPPRVRDSLVFDGEGRMRELKPTFFNAAFPGMVAPAAQPGERLTIDGVLADGPLAIALPAPPLRVRVTFGGQRDEILPRIDQIAIEPDQRRAFVAWRYPFRYRVTPGQQRRVELVPVESA